MNPDSLLYLAGKKVGFKHVPDDIIYCVRETAILKIQRPIKKLLAMSQDCMQTPDKYTTQQLRQCILRLSINTWFSDKLFPDKCSPMLCVNITGFGSRNHGVFTYQIYHELIKNVSETEKRQIQKAYLNSFKSFLNGMPRFVLLKIIYKFNDVFTLMNNDSDIDMDDDNY